MNGKQIVNFLAYISVALIAIVLIIGKLLGWLVNPNILNLLNMIAQIIAYIIFVVLIIVFVGLNIGGIVKALQA